jgi:hypothetical protein
MKAALLIVVVLIGGCVRARDVEATMLGTRSAEAERLATAERWALHLNERLQEAKDDLHAAKLSQVTAESLLGYVRLGVLLTLVGLLTATTVLGRRRGLERDEEHRRRLNLTRIVLAAHKFNLIKEDKQLRQGAREFAGEAAHCELKLALAAEQPPAAAMPATSWMPPPN